MWQALSNNQLAEAIIGRWLHQGLDHDDASVLVHHLLKLGRPALESIILSEDGTELPGTITYIFQADVNWSN